MSTDVIGLSMGGATIARCIIGGCSGRVNPARRVCCRCAGAAPSRTVKHHTTPMDIATATINACNDTGRPTKPRYGEEPKCAKSKDAIDPTKLAATATPITNGCWRRVTHGPMSQYARRERQVM